MTGEERRTAATMGHGGALALTEAALIVLDGQNATSDELQHAAFLLHNAAKAADHAALCTRLAATHEEADPDA